MDSVYHNLEVGSDQWIDLLMTGAGQLGIDMDHHQASQFGRYAQILQQWNRKINLTSITDPMEVAVKHFLDSLAPSACIPQQGTILDIGTGGGFPGIPLKIMRPDQPMVLIDGIRKKINFVKQVLRELHLDHIEAFQLRAEELIRDQTITDQYDIIVCRALADVDELFKLAAPLLKPNGRLVVYQGSRATASKPNSGAMVYRGTRFDCSKTTYSLPFTGHQRAIAVFFRKSQ
ncbi:MAG: 16S rRNA (guanine(527)-N(7))-methyltransferase RsmG [Desulfobacteraceae bacterium]|jgi:16S rRNA (guanine527-N7)-methyltransferase